MKKWWAIVPLALFAGLLVVSLMRLTGQGRELGAGNFDSPERPAPSLRAATLDGGEIALSDGGEPVLVNFFASWCTPCRAEHPLMVEMEKQGAPIIGVLYKDKVEDGQELLARDGDPFKRVILDPQGELALQLGITGVPETFLIDARGMIVKSLRGPMDAGKAQEFLDAWRAEAAKGSS
jgi:cytochrome c biogenesis protein CcmG, thiol:disulfide interchange protein DsbE